MFLPFVSDCKPLRGCVTGRNFLQVSLLCRGRISCGPGGRRKTAPLHQEDWALLLFPLPVGERGRVRGILAACGVKFLGREG